MSSKPTNRDLAHVDVNDCGVISKSRWRRIRMGLDAVELVMTVEEKFGISITDEEATRVVSVGDLKRLVTTKLDVAYTDGCLTQRAFHLIRKNATAEFGMLRRNIRP